jgi:hypothetical protein
MKPNTAMVLGDHIIRTSMDIDPDNKPLLSSWVFDGPKSAGSLQPDLRSEDRGGIAGRLATRSGN